MTRCCLFVVLLFLTPDNFLSFDWRWQLSNMPVDYAGQWQHVHRCMSGPAMYPCCGGCLGRYDLDNDGDVDLQDVAEYQRRT